MTKKVQDPKIERIENHSVVDEKVTHPAFGTIELRRYTSTGHKLFQSDHRHHSFIGITINYAELNRALNNDWVNSRKEIVSIMMTESQFATFITAAGIGGGTPCTLDRVQQEDIPAIGEVEPKMKLFDRELMNKLQEMAAKLKKEKQDLAPVLAKMPAMARKQIEDTYEKLRMMLTDSAPWIQKQFAEFMEETVETAKGEIEAHANRRRAELAAIGQQALEQNTTQQEQPRYLRKKH